MTLGSEGPGGRTKQDRQKYASEGPENMSVMSSTSSGGSLQSSASTVRHSVYIFLSLCLSLCLSLYLSLCLSLCLSL